MEAQIDIVKVLTEKLTKLEAQLEMSKNSIVSNNFIVKVGAYTVSKGDDNKAMLTLKDLPSQWSEKGVAEILKCEFTNTKGKVKPEVIAYKDYYKEQIAEVKQTLEFLQKAA